MIIFHISNPTINSTSVLRCWRDPADLHSGLHRLLDWSALLVGDQSSHHYRPAHCGQLAATERLLPLLQGSGNSTRRVPRGQFNRLGC